MPFKFKMQKVLEYRELLEEQAKITLAKALNVMREEKEKIQSLQVLIFDNETQLFDAPYSNSGDRWLLEHFIKGLKEDMTTSALRLRALDEAYHEAQNKYIYLAKERKVLDKYKSNQLETHNKNESFKEQRDNDETATMRYKIKSF